MANVQRFVRAAEVCANCGGVDTFRKYVTKKTGGGDRIDYLRCRVCGQLATRVTHCGGDGGK